MIFVLNFSCSFDVVVSRGELCLPMLLEASGWILKGLISCPVFKLLDGLELVTSRLIFVVKHGNGVSIKRK